MARAPLEQDAVAPSLSRLVGTVRRAHDELRALVAGSGTGAPDDVLADWLYSHWYSCPEAAADSARRPPGRARLVSALRAALAAVGRWETGWVALKVLPDNACLAGRGWLTRIVASGDYANVARPGVPAAPGDGLAVLDRLEWVDEATGFWAVRSLAAEPAHPLRRLYWSVGWEYIGAVLRRLVPMLDAAQRPWSLKCPSQTADFTRVDSLVVYVSRADWPVFEPLVRTLAPQLAGWLRVAVPPLTLPVARGVALADNPAQAQSFGQHRCSALADGVRGLLAGGHLPIAEAVALLEQSLRASGIDPARPWACD